MFDALTKNLDGILRKLRGTGVITEDNTREAMREIRMALLEADVSYKVVKDFINACIERSKGHEVLRSVAPGQQIVKIVHDELVNLMGPVDHTIRQSERGPVVIMLAGLQGSGKTTMAAKLALYLTHKGHSPLLVAADVQRPAAIEQLKVLGQQLNVPVYAEEGGRPPRICERAVQVARDRNCDVVVLDTAGRLHIDQALMEELREVKERARPQHIFLVCDAMTGQDAVNSANEFNQQLEIDGVILTKLDGDARGGAALSIKAVTGKPIKFIGVGEKLEALEEFHPDRMASRILGMGDVVSFVEKVQAQADVEKARELEEKIRKRTLTLEDFLEQLQQVKKLGSLKDVLGLLPGTGGLDFSSAQNEIPRVEAIVRSMTPRERLDPDMIETSRRHRIAAGSGTTAQEVNQLLKQFRQMKKMMKTFSESGGKGKALGGLMTRMPGGAARAAGMRPGKRPR